MTIQGLSRRAVLQGAAGSAIGALPAFVSVDAKAADKINLTLPWIPEGEVCSHGILFWRLRTE
jgi:hypothetical protein